MPDATSRYLSRAVLGEGVGRTKPDDLTKEEVVAALAECGGNATLTAKKLGLHRTQLSRLRSKFGLTQPDAE